MEQFICNKLVERVENNKETLKNLLEYTDYNSVVMANPFRTKQNTLIAMCIFSKITFAYAYYDIDTLIKSWNINYKLIETEDVLYMIFYTDDYIVVAFKGTTTFKDVISDLKFIQVDDTYNIPGQFHQGFHDLILKNGLAKKIHNDILEIKKEIKNENFKLIITGHSLGAALATVFHAYLKNTNTNTISQLITYGSPRVGDTDFSNYIESTRVVQGNDIVTKLPIIGYKHIIELVHVGNKYSRRYFSDHHLEKYYLSLIDAELKDKDTDTDTQTNKNTDTNTYTEEK